MARPILVTGAHRSGSTWVGLVLVRAPGTLYVNEPFHLNHRPGHCGATWDRWYQYVGPEDEQRFGPPLERTLGLRYDFAAEWRAGRSSAGRGTRLRDFVYYTRGRLRGARPVMKDPIAFFSTPWLARRFGMDVVVLVRHPAAFASSLKRVGWRFDPEELLAQPALVRDLLGPYEDELRALAARERDVIDEAIALWRVVYGLAARWREEHPDWRFERHEDLSREPFERFPALFEALDLEFGDAARAYLSETTSADNPADVAADVRHAHRRDSRAAARSWETRLEPEEIARVRDALAQDAAPFYDASDW